MKFYSFRFIDVDRGVLMKVGRVDLIQIDSFVFFLVHFRGESRVEQLTLRFGVRAQQRRTKILTEGRGRSV